MLKQADLTIQHTMRNACKDLQQADTTFCLAPQTQSKSLFAFPAFLCEFWTLMQTSYLPRR